jgi:NADP-dependent 3-hydroxy acid dehydrogenase YdfG
MLILVLGASSSVGAALSEVFSRGNSLILTGRNPGKLNAAACKCRDAGAVHVRYVEQDLALGVGAILEAIKGNQIDLVIDAASASSSLRDPEIESKDIAGYVSADVLSRTVLMDHILINQGVAPAMIFISTILTLVKSPGRVIYTALKEIYESYLLKLKRGRPDFRLLIAYVGAVIDTERETPKPRKLASAVFEAFKKRRKKLIFGASGIALLILFYFQPVLYYCVNVTQRKIREIFG